jgi:hypothetical protein
MKAQGEAVAWHMKEMSDVTKKREKNKIEV